VDRCKIANLLKILISMAIELLMLSVAAHRLAITVVRLTYAQILEVLGHVNPLLRESEHFIVVHFRLVVTGLGAIECRLSSEENVSGGRASNTESRFN
jgi:hypothetical protein